MNNSDQEFKCVLCDDTFTTKEELQVHFRKHADPNFKQKKGGEQNETEESVEKTKGPIEMVECDVCPEMFTSISKAITHKHKVHPDHDTKYFCAWCGKLFTMKHLYNKHIKSVHSTTEMSSDDKCFHCDVCDVDFIHAAMVYHNKFYHRQDELPIIGHSKKLKMVTQDTVQIYYCPFCGEEYDNKVNLHKHMTEEHSDENQTPEEVLRCPLCDAIFYHLDAYELHLTYHSTDDLYAERNQLIEETTDFSLETVQPQREKIENALCDPQTENGPMMGIEELLEFSMNDDNTPGKKKSKKHKKHKKSKKAAITLDEFLNMNKDVFGEGIDFQGVEEVPTQVITKRLKTKKPSTKVVSDIAKLKKQGIVIKKQIKVGKPTTVNKVTSNQVVKTLKKLSPPKIQMSKLSSTDDVLSKLLNQGSQIKIVKKTNQDEEQSQKDDNNDTKLSSADEKNIAENSHSDNICCKPDESKSHNAEQSSGDDDATENEPVNASPATPTVSPPSNDNDNELNTLDNSDKITNNKKENIDGGDGSNNDKLTLVDSLAAFKNNSNIAVKKSNQNRTSNTEEKISELSESGKVDDETNESHDDEKLNKTNEKPSLNALKHLSHLITIKPVSKISPVQEKDPENGSQAEGTATQIKSNSPKTINVKNQSYVKNLGEITIKPSPNSQKPPPQLANSMSSPDHDKHYSGDEWSEDDDNVHDKNNVPKIDHVLKNPQLNVQTKHSPTTKDKESPRINANNDNSRSSADIVKHLKNITVNSVNNQKIQTPKSSPSSLKPAPVQKSSVQKEISKEGIEIYSIDDSDSDEGNNKNKSTNSANTNNSKVETQSINVLKNIHKGITIKTNKVERQVNPLLKAKCENSGEDFDGDEDNEAIPCKPTNSFNGPKQSQNSGAVHNVLKFLGKNITVKSRNSSPSQSIQSQDHNSRDSQLDANDAHSDPDPKSPRVKITEIENHSDDEFTEGHDDNDISHNNAIVKVQHPDDSHSDHDELMDDDFDDMADFEAQIRTTTLQKPSNISKPQKVQSNLNQLQSISKEMTVKSPQNKHVSPKSENVLGSEDIPQFPKSLGNQISIKQIKRPENKINKQAEQRTTSVSNQSLINQKVASSSNQVNTSNKEVKTVKTYRTQTETVIEEITTTVTKTIKTVNQTTKQEVRNVGQTSSKALPQKVQGMKPNVIPKNFQGIKVRQSGPIPINVRPKIRGTPPQMMRPAICAPPQVSRASICAPQVTRPAICAPPRASNQLVPVRPSARPTGPRPRLPGAINVRASTSGQQKAQAGKSVKISPGAVISSSPKRPAEPAGHFSCFKKPKESLIPVPDFSDADKSDGESVQFSSAVHMSKSNFSSTTKVVKGNSVVSSTKMKSEMSANSQQLSKLQGMSGLSVVKTSQAKQNHVEEHTEVSASQRNTLQAIQKLQNQGLLVKKPRLDVNEDSDHSQPHSDDMGHDSNEEFDDFE